MTKVHTELARALRQVRIYDKKEVNRAFAALKEENERLSDGLSHHMNISQVLSDGNANMHEMVMERDAEIELLKARVAELEAETNRLTALVDYL